MDSLTFTLSEGFYTADSITGGDNAIVILHLEYPGVTSRVIIERTIDTTANYAVVLDTIISDAVFEYTITDAFTGVNYRVRSEVNPTNAGSISE